MSIVSPNMGLTLWNNPNDNFNYLQFLNNLTAIDVHDHSSGKGVQIGQNGIQSSAITTPKIATGAVGSTQLAVGAVGTNQLAGGAVTGAKIASNTIGTSQVSQGYDRNPYGFLTGSNGFTINTATNTSPTWLNTFSYVGQGMTYTTGGGLITPFNGVYTFTVTVILISASVLTGTAVLNITQNDLGKNPSYVDNVVFTGPGLGQEFTIQNSTLLTCAPNDIITANVYQNTGVQLSAFIYLAGYFVSAL